MLRVPERQAGITSSVTGEEAINSLARSLVYSIYVIYQDMQDVLTRGWQIMTCRPNPALHLCL